MSARVRNGDSDGDSAAEVSGGGVSWTVRLNATASRASKLKWSGQRSRLNSRLEGWPRTREGKERAVSSIPLAFSFLFTFSFLRSSTLPLDPLASEKKGKTVERGKSSVEKRIIFP